MWSPQVCFLASFHLFIDIRAPFSFSLKVSVAHQQTMISANWSILFGLVLNIHVKERWGEAFRRTKAHVKTTFNAHQFRNVKPNCIALYYSRERMSRDALVWPSINRCHWLRIYLTYLSPAHHDNESLYRIQRNDANLQTRSPPRK